MGMIRNLMRSIRKVTGNRASMSGNVAVGSHRAGMHQKSEHEWQRVQMTEAEQVVTPPEEEDVEDALEVPAEVEAETPPEEEPAAEEVAGADAAVAADPEILEEVADPDAAAKEEETGDLLPEASEEEQLSVDYSGERVNAYYPVTGGVDADPRELVYDPGDGTPKEIEMPAVLQEAIQPAFPEIEDPSANVPAAPES